MYEIESRVRYSECDEFGSLSLVGLINYLQDCTTFHSEDIGRGVTYMKQRHIAWLIAAWQIEIERLPHFGERIRVATWCHTMARTLASRNFVIYDEEGTELIRADSQWFVYDFDAERPVRIAQDQLVYLSDEPPLNMPPTKRRIKLEGTAQEAPSLVVTEAHLDSNRHVNNAQYLGMAVQALAADESLREHDGTPDIRRIVIAYQRQAYLGDVVVPHIYHQQDTCSIDLTTPDGDSYATVRLELAPQVAGADA